MKPDKRQLATLHDMETWAYKVKKDAKEWKRNVENVFHEEYIMIISERIFKILKDKNMTQMEFAKRTGFSNSAISDWKRKKTNPSAEKIMDICYALDVTPEQLLTGVGIDDVSEITSSTDRVHIDKTDIKLLEDYHGMQAKQKKRLLAYVETLKKLESLEDLK